jgi:hypothetical protein
LFEIYNDDGGADGADGTDDSIIISTNIFFSFP